MVFVTDEIYRDITAPHLKAEFTPSLPLNGILVFARPHHFLEVNRYFHPLFSTEPIPHSSPLHARGARRQSLSRDTATRPADQSLLSRGIRRNSFSHTVEPDPDAQIDAPAFLQLLYSHHNMRAFGSERQIHLVWVPDDTELFSCVGTPPDFDVETPLRTRWPWPPTYKSEHPMDNADDRVMPIPLDQSPNVEDFRYIVSLADRRLPGYSLQLGIVYEEQPDVFRCVVYEPPDDDLPPDPPLVLVQGNLNAPFVNPMKGAADPPPADTTRRPFVSVNAPFKAPTIVAKSGAPVVRPATITSSRPLASTNAPFISPVIIQQPGGSVRTALRTTRTAPPRGSIDTPFRMPVITQRAPPLVSSAIRPPASTDIDIPTSLFVADDDGENEQILRARPIVPTGDRQVIWLLGDNSHGTRPSEWLNNLQPTPRSFLRFLGFEREPLPRSADFMKQDVTIRRHDGVQGSRPKRKEPEAASKTDKSISTYGPIVKIDNEYFARKIAQWRYRFSILSQSSGLRSSSISRTLRASGVRRDSLPGSTPANQYQHQHQHQHQILPTPIRPLQSRGVRRDSFSSLVITGTTSTSSPLLVRGVRRDSLEPLTDDPRVDTTPRQPRLLAAGVRRDSFQGPDVDITTAALPDLLSRFELSMPTGYGITGGYIRGNPYRPNIEWAIVEFLGEAFARTGVDPFIVHELVRRIVDSGFEPGLMRQICDLIIGLDEDSVLTFGSPTTGNGRWKCPKCNTLFHTAIERNKHFLLKHFSRPSRTQQRCPSCGYSTLLLSVEQNAAHTASCILHPQKCANCNTMLSDLPYALAISHQGSCKPTTGKSKDCDFCSASIPQNLLLRHLTYTCGQIVYDEAYATDAHLLIPQLYCPRCLSGVFANHRLLGLHVIACGLTKDSIQCSICGDIQHSADGLHEHEDSAHGLKDILKRVDLVCRRCGGGPFTDKLSLDQHTNTCDGSDFDETDQSWICQQCDSSYARDDLARFVAHRRFCGRSMNVNADRACDGCGYLSHHIQAREGHLRRCRFRRQPIDRRPPLTCRTCQSTFGRNLVAFLAHQGTHELECNRCRSRFDTVELLQEHRKGCKRGWIPSPSTALLPAGVRFPCRWEGCEIASPFSWQRREHEKSCSLGIICRHPGCTQTFIRRKDQLTHERTCKFNPNPTAAPYACKWASAGCTKTFTQRRSTNVPRHERTCKFNPNPATRYACKWASAGCTKTFTRERDLPTHEATCKFNPNPTTTEHACGWASAGCMQTFKQKASADRHGAQTCTFNPHPTTEYACKWASAGCTSTYTREDGARRHELTCKFNPHPTTTGYACKWASVGCEKMFRQKGNANRHEAICEFRKDAGGDGGD